MPPIFTPDSGMIDSHKVRFAIFSCRMIFLRVIVINTLLNAFFVFFVFRDVVIAFITLTLYVCSALFVLLDVCMQNNNVSIKESPECIQPDTPIFNEIVALWAACCLKAGYHTPGAVYVVLPIPDAYFSQIKYFAVQRTPFRSRPPALFIAVEMFNLCSREELFAAIHHEAGHLRTVPHVVWCLADIVSLPMTMSLRIIGHLRRTLPVWCKIPKYILYQLERGLHFVTMFAANHADEYGADAYAALNQGTVEHLVALLVLLNSFHKRENLEYMRGQFTLDDETHQSTHPMVKERIARLLHLHKHPQ